ncbi:MAG: flagellar basal body rod C-terminal domain-containing protein [Alphaproteobacteria bacterium]|nr:flagellar basal body rod C-terminal domain-containing protein [Alphaproteobacteria bacterium]
MSGVFQIAVSGMAAASKKMLNAATNIANASTTGKLPQGEGDAGTVYRPTDVVTISNSVADNKFGVTATTVERDPAYSIARDEGSPDANDEGLVAVPNVDLASEAVDTLMAQLAYKANAKVIEAERENQKALMDTLS